MSMKPQEVLALNTQYASLTKQVNSLNALKAVLEGSDQSLYRYASQVSADSLRRGLMLAYNKQALFLNDNGVEVDTIPLETIAALEKVEVPGGGNEGGGGENTGEPRQPDKVIGGAMLFNQPFPTLVIDEGPGGFLSGVSVDMWGQKVIFNGDEWVVFGNSSYQAPQA